MKPVAWLVDTHIISEMMKPNPEPRVAELIDGSVNHARICAKITEEKRQMGEPLDDHVPDAFLVAVAKCHDLTLITKKYSGLPKHRCRIVESIDGLTKLSTGVVRSQTNVSKDARPTHRTLPSNEASSPN